MKNYFYFSDSFQPFIAKLKFLFSIAGYFFKILFKKRKAIRLIKLEYAQKYVFDKSYLVVSYQFENALWYHFKNIISTTKSNTIAFNLKNLKTKDITLTVYGLFQKKRYHINARSENTLATNSFKTSIAGVNRPIGFAAPVEAVDNKPQLNIPPIPVVTKVIAINHTSYNQTDFI